MKVRAHLFIDERVWKLFVALCPHGDRSKVIEHLLAKWSVDNHERVFKRRRAAKALKKLKPVPKPL